MHRDFWLPTEVYKAALTADNSLAYHQMPNKNRGTKWGTSNDAIIAPLLDVRRSACLPPVRLSHKTRSRCVLPGCGRRRCADLHAASIGVLQDAGSTSLLSMARQHRPTIQAIGSGDLTRIAGLGALGAGAAGFGRRYDHRGCRRSAEGSDRHHQLKVPASPRPRISKESGSAPMPAI